MVLFIFIGIFALATLTYIKKLGELEAKLSKTESALLARANEVIDTKRRAKAAFSLLAANPNGLKFTPLDGKAKISDHSEPWMQTPVITQDQFGRPQIFPEVSE
jgi:hypothetical protein